MTKCSFCAKEISPGTGMIFVYKTGKVTNFCSRKCELHTLKLHRKPQNMKWVTSVGKDKSKK
ncbi:MAG: large subunit ribosomal protein L24e [archaeon GW2011_AR17]|nr:MAG: large subunit ribosomal protein L24e [archaeon GW2011_AR17]MBS3154686.1 50S ribosomal protein L24e [Candidatus Woesearchaeota archaeon]HIH14989.1 50S ribosomal protein L24e [Nanoarchaeota archaeon]HIH58794.1 50S ribosomal protein L24e [Nanoarchaeota archaeon]HII13525.1 50S ribosomal protein L24e [Nanoarchaeota archaeon]